MYNVSNEWKRKIYEDDLKSRITIFINQQLIDANILSFKITHKLFDDGEFKLGTTTAQAITLKLYKNDVINAILEEGVRIVHISYGILIDNNYEDIPLGAYNVDNIETDNNTITLNLIDNMIKFNKTFDGSTLDYPISLKDLLKAICNTCGVRVDNNSLNITNLENKIATYDSSITARQYIGYIAEMAGGFAYINRHGELSIKTFEDISNIIEKLPKKQWGDKHVISRVTFQDGLRNYTFGNNRYNTLIIDPNNLFVTTEDEIRNIYSTMKDLEFYSLKTEKSRANPALDVGDIVTIDGKKVIYQYDIELSGRFLGNIDSEVNIKAREDTTIKKENATSRLRKVQAIIDQINNEIYTVVEETGEKKSNITKLMQKLEEISTQVQSVTDFTKEAEGIGNVEVTDAANTLLCRLEIQAKDDVLNINNGSRVNVSVSNDESLKYYRIDTFEILQNLDDVCDLIVIEKNSETDKYELKIEKYIENVPILGEYEVDVGDTDYSFFIDEDGYYESNNKAINSSFAMCKLKFEIPSESTGKLILDCINYAESNYDFGILSEIDTELTKSSVIDTTGVYKSFKGESSSEVKTITYENITPGEHFICIKYRKDGSTHTNNDSLKFKVQSLQIGTEKRARSTPVEILVNSSFDIELNKGINRISLLNSKLQQVDLKMKVKYITNNELNEYMAMKTYLGTYIKQNAEQIATQVIANIDDQIFGTKIVQNKDSVKLAWNQSGQNIKLELDDDKNACLNIYDKKDNLLMSLKFDGVNFFENTGDLLGRMGIKKINDKDFITFDVPISPNSSLDNGMAWGMTPDDGNDFIPVMYISDFNYNPNSGISSGIMHLPNMLLEIGRAMKVGSITIANMDPLTGDLTFIDDNSNILMKVIPQNDNLGIYKQLQILDYIHAYENAGGSQTFKVGDETDYVNIASSGQVVATQSIIARSFENLSSVNSKKNIEKYEKSAVEEILKTDIYSYLYNDENDDAKRTIGAIIGEKYKCSSDIITKDGKHISTYSMIALAYKAIQEHQEIINKQQKQINDLTTRLNLLESRGK